MSETDQKTPDFDDVAAMLREQIALCHSLTRATYNTFCNERNREAQDDTLKGMTRLVQVTASAASALNRVTGTQIRRASTIARENAKTNSSGSA